MRLAAQLATSLLAAGLLLAPPALRAQGDCGPVTAVQPPVDPDTFQLVQLFGIPSPRHQGRYHTGEDWYGGRGTSYGQPVRAIAAGRVTYSAPAGWGRDGGVVIIEHTLPDGSVLYSQYGHMQDASGYPFPPRYSCVRMGDIIGGVGDARPAPHLHFEIRVNQPDVPGPGYTWTDPVALGWRPPSAALTNWAAWLHPAHRWHLELAAPAATSPAVLDDNSLVYLDAGRARRATPDGRVLWRLNLDREAVGVAARAGIPVIIYADGSLQAVGLDGAPVERWSLNEPLRAVFEADGQRLAQTTAGALISLSADLQSVVWRLEGLPPITRLVAAPGAIGALAADNTLLTLSPAGRLLDRAQLREPGALAAAPDGTLLAYTRGGLWRVDSAGVWALVLADQAPPGGAGTAALQDSQGRLILYGVTGVPALRAYNQDGALLWATPVPLMPGAVALAQHGPLLLLASGGDLVVARAADGALCGQIRLHGDPRAPVWSRLGSDGILRLVAGAQIAAYDWAALSQGCG